MRFLKWFGSIVVVLAILFFIFLKPYFREQTKKFSPQKTETYVHDGLNLSVTYCSPFKKGRIIFGELVPYNKVWRTGANEPTTFTTATNIKIGDKKLAAGTYSLWTKPNEKSWSVIFNKDVPEWGVTLLSAGKETTRDPKDDAVQIEVPTEKLSSPQESFLIAFEGADPPYLTFSWDETEVKVPINL